MNLISSPATSFIGLKGFGPFTNIKELYTGLQTRNPGFVFQIHGTNQLYYFSIHRVMMMANFTK